MIYYTLREFATLPAIFVGGAPRPIDDEEIGTSEWMDGQRMGKGKGVFFFQGIHALLCGMDGTGRGDQSSIIIIIIIIIMNWWIWTGGAF